MQRLALSFARGVGLAGRSNISRTSVSVPSITFRACTTSKETGSRSTKSSNTSSSKDSSKAAQPKEAPTGLRINKCFPEYSRTQADRLIKSGRVTVNGKPAELGTKLIEGDVVMLDTTVVAWSQYEEKKASTPYPEGLNTENGFVYIKYYKDVGVTTTTGRDPEGVLNTGHFKDVKQVVVTDGVQKEESAVPVDRLLPVGRLDKDSNGLLLLTSDPRLPAWVLGANTGCTKVYEVLLNRVPKEADVLKWQTGVTLTTASSTGKDKRVHPTLPCKVKVIGPSSTEKGGCWVQFSLREGRNRQIRRMVHALNYQVMALHRTSFCGVQVAGLTPGKWEYLSEAELALLRRRR